MFLYLDFTKDNLIGFEVEKYFCVKKINNNKKTSERINELIIQTLNDAKLRERIGNSGRKYVVENFSWESSNKALIKILSDK